jgi:hypothetical protein
MLHLLALSDFSGAVNLTADGIVLACTFVSLWQVGYRIHLSPAATRANLTEPIR